MGIYNIFCSPSRFTQDAICHSLLDEHDVAAFTGPPEFQDLRFVTLPLEDQVTGTNIEFSSADGKPAKGYLIKAKKKSNKWVFVFHDWNGLSEFVRNQSDQFYNDLGGSVNVLALDMYDGKATSDPKEADQLVQGVEETRLENIVNGGMAYAGNNAQIVSLGWSFGGDWSLKSALLLGKQNIGSVIYYGMPILDVKQLKNLYGDVLGLFATETFISKKVIEEFASNMKSVGKHLDYKIFDAAHGFAKPSHPNYDKASSIKANAMTLDYLKKKFKF